MPPRTAKVRYPLTKDGKALLRAAAVRKGLGPTELGKRIGVSHAAVEQIWADGSTDTKPTWSSHAIPALCHELDVPLWAVVAGFDDDQRDVLAAMALVHEFAPGRYSKVVADFIEKARDVCRAAGWRPERTTSDDGAPPEAGRETQVLPTR